MFLLWPWPVSLTTEKRKACLIVGSSYLAMNRVVLSRYGIHLPKPDYTEYRLEIAKVGIHFHYLTDLSSRKFRQILGDCNFDYPSHKYDLEIVIVLSKDKFLSEKLKRTFNQTRNLIFYLKDDVTLLKETKLEDLSLDYFSQDPLDEDEEENEEESKESLDKKVNETTSLIELQDEVEKLSKAVANINIP